MKRGGWSKKKSSTGNPCARIDIRSFYIWQYCPVLIDPFGVAFAKWSELGGGIQSEVTETRNRTKFPNTSEYCMYISNSDLRRFSKDKRVSGIYFPAFSSVKCVFFWHVVVFALTPRDVYLYSIPFQSRACAHAVQCWLPLELEPVLSSPKPLVG